MSWRLIFAFWFMFPFTDFNSFFVNLPILYLLKTQEKQMFCGVIQRFREYKKGTLARNGLIWCENWYGVKIVLLFRKLKFTPFSITLRVKYRSNNHPYRKLQVQIKRCAVSEDLVFLILTWDTPCRILLFVFWAAAQCPGCSVFVVNLKTIKLEHCGISDSELFFVKLGFFTGFSLFLLFYLFYYLWSCIIIFLLGMFFTPSVKVVLKGSEGIGFKNDSQVEITSSSCLM